MILGVSEVFGVGDELISKRHHKDRVLIGAAEKFHVVFEQGLNNELACDVVKLRAALVLHKGIQQLVDLSLTSLWDHLSDLLDNADSILGILG